MSVFRVFINNEDTGEYVTGSSIQDAYSDVAAAIPLRYDDRVELREINSSLEKPGFPIGTNTIRSTNTPLFHQELYITKPEKDK